MLCSGEGGMLFEGGGTVQGRDDRTMQPGAMNIQKHVHTSRSPFHFLVVLLCTTVFIQKASQEI